MEDWILYISVRQMLCSRFGDSIKIPEPAKSAYPEGNIITIEEERGEQAINESSGLDVVLSFTT